MRPTKSGTNLVVYSSFFFFEQVVVYSSYNRVFFSFIVTFISAKLMMPLSAILSLVAAFQMLKHKRHCLFHSHLCSKSEKIS